MSDQEWLTLPDAVFGARGRLTRWQLYTAAMEGKVDAKRKGIRWLVRKDSLDRYLDQHREAL